MYSRTQIDRLAALLCILGAVRVHIFMSFHHEISGGLVDRKSEKYHVNLEKIISISSCC